MNSWSTEWSSSWEVVPLFFSYQGLLIGGLTSRSWRRRAIRRVTRSTVSLSKASVVQLLTLFHPDQATHVPTTRSLPPKMPRNRVFCRSDPSRLPSCGRSVFGGADTVFCQEWRNVKKRGPFLLATVQAQEKRAKTCLAISGGQRTREGKQALVGGHSRIRRPAHKQLQSPPALVSHPSRQPQCAQLSASLAAWRRVQWPPLAAACAPRPPRQPRSRRPGTARSHRFWCVLAAVEAACIYIYICMAVGSRVTDWLMWYCSCCCDNRSRRTRSLRRARLRRRRRTT